MDAARKFCAQITGSYHHTFLGWLIAKLVRSGSKRMLRLMSFDNFAQKSGLEAFMSHGNIHLSLSDIVSQVMYWLVIILFVITGANALGLNEVAVLLHQLASYLPHIIVAIVVVILVLYWQDLLTAWCLRGCIVLNFRRHWR